MQKSTNFCDLTDDCLINILKHCDVKGIGRLGTTCKRLNNVIKKYDTLWIYKSRHILGSNMNSPFMVDRSMPVLEPLGRVQVAQNWVSGNAQKTSVMRYMSCIPWMCMEQDYLFVSKGRRIVKLARGDDGNILPGRVSSSYLHEDISRFVLNGIEILSVSWEGSFCRFQKSSLHCNMFQGIHKAEVLGLDSEKDIVVTGSRDKTIKIWKMSPSFQPLTQVEVFSTKVRVLCLSLLPSRSYLVAGLPGTRNIHPLPVYDIQTGQMLLNLGLNFRNGAGVLDIYPETENLILTCGYDTRVKLWDVRTPRQCVSLWTEPYDNTLNSVKSDYSHTIIAGACRSGFFHVWDKRTTNVVQTHFSREFNSSVYCLQFDASHVFTALNRAVVQHSFM